LAFQEVSGDCGPLPSQTVTVNSDGTVSDPVGVSCAVNKQTQCQTQLSGCTWGFFGFAYNLSGTLSFASDGSSGTGVYTVARTGLSVCNETYNVTITRQ
jgi:hypothetical protein